MNDLSYEIIKTFIKSTKMSLFSSLNCFDKYPKHPSISSCIWPTIKKPNLTSSNTSLAINNNRNGNECQFLLSFTQLLIEGNKFLIKSFKPIMYRRFIIHVDNTIYLARNMQRMSYVANVQTIILTLKLELPPMFTKTATRIQL